MSVKLVDVSSQSVSDLKKLIMSTLPVFYPPNFYKAVLQNPSLCKIAVLGDVRDHRDTSTCNKDYRPSKKRKCLKDNYSSKENYIAETCNMTLPIGMVCCRHEGKTLYITALGCLAYYRRNGVGSKLLRHVFKCACLHNADSIQLHVQALNEDALCFYKSFGFVITDKIRGYYKYLKSPDALLLTKNPPFQ